MLRWENRWKLYEIDVIGKKAWDILLAEVTRGNIDDQKMLDFSRQLGSKVGGKHSRRGKSDEAEMREILSVSLIGLLPQLESEI